MAPQARIIIFDDDQDWVETIKEELTNHGHTVVATADSIEELQRVLTTVENIDVALLDNQAPWKSGEQPDYMGVGEVAEEEIRKALGENVTTISLTATENPKYGEHHYSGGVVNRLGDFITALPRKEG